MTDVCARRIAVAIAIILSAGLMGAVPAAAFEIVDTKGKIGEHRVKDKLAKPGAICKFEDRVAQIDEELNKIKVRAVKTFGQRAATTWVGYRFSILRRSWPSPDYEFVFKSPIVKKRASRTQKASFGWRTWLAPEDLPASDFRVMVHFFFYERGSKTKVEGRIRGVMEVYRHKHPAAPGFLVGKPGDGGECFYNFWT